jgi:hypothetical protein
VAKLSRPFKGQVTVRPEVDRVISSIGVNEVASGSRWLVPVDPITH